jgi:hypothetical protein
MESRSTEDNSQKKRIILGELRKFDLVNEKLRTKLNNDNNDIDVSQYYAEALKPIIPDLISKRRENALVRAPRLNPAAKFQELLSLCYKGELSQEIFQEIMAGIDEAEKINYEYQMAGTANKATTDNKTNLNIGSTPTRIDTTATTTTTPSFVIQPTVQPQPVVRDNAENKREVNSEVSVSSNQEQAKSLRIQMTYPASYEEAYKKASSPLEGVVELFRDYCGASSSNYAYLFSFKHKHTATVNNFINEYISTSDYKRNKLKRNPEDVKEVVVGFMTKLKDALLQAGAPLEPAPKGSLALRILFVQDKFKLDCINLNELCTELFWTTRDANRY